MLTTVGATSTRRAGADDVARNPSLPTTMKLSVLAAFVTCTVSNRFWCDAFYGPVQVIVRTRHRLCNNSRSIISHNTSYSHRRSHRRSSLKAHMDGDGEGRRCSSPGGSDRRDFVRGAAVALVGCSATIFGGGRKASAVGTQPGERTTAPPNALLLVPALRAKLAVEEVLKLLKDPAKWDQAREALKSPPLAPADFKTCFRTYSDADPEQHLAFDLYRIQAQEALKAVSELLAYLASEKAKGAEIVPEDVDDLEDAGRSVLQGIDDFLNLAPREDVLKVECNTKDQAARETATKKTIPAGRELEGAVVGEGAFVAGARI